MKNLRLKIFKHIIEYDWLYFWGSAISSSVILYFIEKYFKNELAIFYVLIFFAYIIFLFYLRKKAFDMARYLKFVDRSFSKQTIREVYKSIKKLDLKEFILLERNYSIYKEWKSKIECETKPICFIVLDIGYIFFCNNSSMIIIWARRMGKQN